MTLIKLRAVEDVYGFVTDPFRGGGSPIGKDVKVSVNWDELSGATPFFTFDARNLNLQASLLLTGLADSAPELAVLIPTIRRRRSDSHLPMPTTSATTQTILLANARTSQTRVCCSRTLTTATKSWTPILVANADGARPPASRSGGRGRRLRQRQRDAEENSGAHRFADSSCCLDTCRR